MDWQNIILDIEEKLFPYYECDIWERSLYYYLFSQSRIRNQKSTTIPLPQISAALRCSNYKSREMIRSLAKKGCIKLEQTRQGHYVTVFLPNELVLPEKSSRETVVDIETEDFYKDRRYLSELLKREQWKCFYCLREIKEDSCELDHVLSQLNGGNNSYKNIVSACHSCNTKKQGGNAEDFVRQLYRKNLLSEKEFEDRLIALESLRNGQIKPII